MSAYRRRACASDWSPCRCLLHSVRLVDRAITRHAPDNKQQGHIMKRRSFMLAGAAGFTAASLPKVSIAQASNAQVLRFVPQANLTVLDPIFTTAAVTANHAWMVYDTLFGVNAELQPKPQMADGYTVSDNG